MTILRELRDEVADSARDWLTVALPCLWFVRWLLLALLALGCLAGSALAQTRYVSTTGTATWANATDVGTPASLATANANAIAGQTVQMADGTYTTRIEPVNGGTVGSRIRFIGNMADPTAVTVTGIKLGADWAQGPGQGFANNRGSYTTVQGVRTTGTVSSRTWDNNLNQRVATIGDSLTDIRLAVTGELGLDTFNGVILQRVLGTVTGGIDMAGQAATGCGNPAFSVLFIAKNSALIDCNITTGRTWNLNIGRFHNILRTRITIVTTGDEALQPASFYNSYGHTITDSRIDITNNSTNVNGKTSLDFRDSTGAMTWLRDTVITRNGTSAQSNLYITNDGCVDSPQSGNTFTECIFDMDHDTVGEGGHMVFADGGFGDVFTRCVIIGRRSGIPAIAWKGNRPTNGTVFDHCTIVANGTSVMGGTMTTASNTRFVGNLWKSQSAISTSARMVTFASGATWDRNLFWSPGGDSLGTISFTGGGGGSPSATGYGRFRSPHWMDSTFTAGNVAQPDVRPRQSSSWAVGSYWPNGYAGAYPDSLGSTPSGDEVRPESVDDLAQSSVTEASITLTWTATGDDSLTGRATSYDLRYSLEPLTAETFDTGIEVAGEPVPETAGSAETMTVGGLATGTRYYFVLKVTDEAGNPSAMSNRADTETDPSGDGTPPGTTSTLAMADVGSASIDLTWTAPGDNGTTGTAFLYDLRYSTSLQTLQAWTNATQAGGEPTPSVAGTLEQYTLTGLNQRTLYYIAIKTRDLAGNESALSNVVSDTTDDLTAPSAVTDLAALSATSSSVVLTWGTPGDDGDAGQATSYDMRRSTSAITEGNWSSATAVTGEPTPRFVGLRDTMTVSGLSAGTTYHFAMKSSDDVGNISDLSNVVSQATASGADNTRPGPITLTATQASSTSITLSWTSVGDDSLTGTAAEYDARIGFGAAAMDEAAYQAAGQLSGEPTPAAPGNAESMTITGLDPNTTYKFGLKVRDEVPNWSALAGDTATTPVTPDESAPCAVPDLSIAAIGSGTLQLRWSSPGDDLSCTGRPTSYDVRYRTGGTLDEAAWAAATTVTGEPVPGAGGAIETLWVTGLVNGTTYHFAVKATDEAGNVGAISNSPTGAPAAASTAVARGRRR